MCGPCGLSGRVLAISTHAPSSASPRFINGPNSAHQMSTHAEQSKNYGVLVGKTARTTDVYARGDSKDSKRHSIAETVDWVPNKLFFLQVNAALVYDTISTAYPDAGELANDVLRNADNNFWNGSILAGFVVNKLTNAQIEASYYKANNYEPAIAAATVPYGFSGREYTVSLGVIRKLSTKWLASAKVGYLDNRNDTSGGNTNFRGP